MNSEYLSIVRGELERINEQIKNAGSDRERRYYESRYVAQLQTFADALRWNAENEQKGMLKWEDIHGDDMQGEYLAVGDNGQLYRARFVNQYSPKGTMFFCIPSTVNILGYMPI